MVIPATKLALDAATDDLLRAVHNFAEHYENSAHLSGAQGAFGTRGAGLHLRSTLLRAAVHYHTCERAHRTATHLTRRT